MNEVNRTELLKALKTISAVCAQEQECLKCPLGDDREDCVLRTCTPDGWCIKDEEESVWRAFNYVS